MITYALKAEIPNILDNLVDRKSLTTKLSYYKKKDNFESNVRNIELEYKEGGSVQWPSYII